MIPSGWQEKTLLDVCKKTISYGIVQTGDGVTNGIPCVRVVDLTKKELRKDDMITTSEEIHQSYKKTILEEGEIMMVLRGVVGLVRSVNKSLVGTNITRGIARLAPKKELVAPDYLLWAMRSQKVRADLMGKVGGSALQEIALASLRKVKILVPPLPEQCEIAKILTTWDKAISTTEALINNSKQQKKALMQQLLTGKKRFAGFTDEWKMSRLGDVITHQKGYAFKSQSYKNTGTRIIRISDTTRNSIHDEAPVYFNSKNIYDLDNYKLVTDDIVLSTVGSRPHLLDSMVGKAVKIPAKDNGALLNQNLVRLAPNENTITSDYLFLMLTNTNFNRFISTLVRGNANQVSIALVELFSYKFLIPTLKEQQAIASVLMAADKEIETLEQKLAYLKQEKRALMQQLLTGKRRVTI